MAGNEAVNPAAGRLLLLTADEAVVAQVRGQMLGLTRLGLGVDRSSTPADAERLVAGRHYKVAILDTRLAGAAAEAPRFAQHGVAVVLLADAESDSGSAKEMGQSQRPVAGYVPRGSLEYTLIPVVYAVLGGMTRATALRRERDAADELVRTRSEFLANMSHEIRTPLHTITGMNELLVGTTLDAEQNEYSSNIGFAAHTLLSLIDDILDVSKFEAGHLELENIDLDLHDVVEESVALVSLEVHNKGLEIASYVAAPVPHLLRGDPVRLRQVLVNLISNAVKFTEQGEIAIEAELIGSEGQQAEIRFSVRDTGVGVPAGRQAALFGAFTQADSSTTRKYGGTGLGLAISKQLTTQMGGQIGIDSTVGAGSTFWFTAKLQLQLQPTVSDRFGALSPDFFEGMRVLVVDDNATASGYIAAHLGEWGCAVERAPNGEEALQKLHAAGVAGRPFAVVLVDLKMPGIDGWHLGSEIHADDSLAPVSVLMTPVGMSGDEAKMKLLGWFDGYLSKPVRKVQLLETLVTLLLFTNEGELEELPSQQEVDPASRVRGPYRVLAAEDHEVNRRLLLTILQKLGHSVTVAEDGQSAVEAGTAAQFDVVLLDIQMPKLSGYQVAARLREAGVTTPIIALTAHAMHSERDRCLAAGMDDILAKPFNTASLIPMLARWLPDAPQQAAVAGTLATDATDATAGGDGRAATGLIEPPPAPDGASAATEPAPAPERAESPDAGTDVFDWREAVATFEGDEDTVTALLASFRTKVAAQLEHIETAIGASDWDLIRSEAHPIKGSAWNLRARRLGDAAGELEHAPRSSAGELAPLLASLRGEYALLGAAVDGLAAETASSL